MINISQLHNYKFDSDTNMALTINHEDLMLDVGLLVGPIMDLILKRLPFSDTVSLIGKWGIMKKASVSNLMIRSHKYDLILSYIASPTQQLC